MTERDITTSTDVDLLWKQLLAAKAAGDAATARQVESRMRALQDDTRFARLTDEELAQRIAALADERAPKGLLAHFPGGSGGSTSDMGGGRGTLLNNHAIRQHQHVGIEATLAALVGERDRRAAPAS